MRLLAKAPADRPASAREVAECLRAIESALPTITALPSPTTTPPTVTADTLSAPIAVTNPGVAVAPTKPPRRRSAFRSAISITLAFCVLAAVAGRVLNKLLLLPPLTTALPPPPPPVRTEFKGSIDVVVFDPDDPRRQNVRLNQPGVLPLKPGDRFAVEAEISPPAYLYILWIDADGSVDPVYPWRRGNWDNPLPEEKPVEQVRRPVLSDRPFGGTLGIKESAQGMETLVMLARKTPLPHGVDLKAELGVIRPQKLRTLQSTAWFENGRLVTNEAGRSAVDWDDEKTDDPVRATEEQIRSRLGPGKDKLFHYTRAVSFAVRGK
jgi:hypothetical protein